MTNAPAYLIQGKNIILVIDGTSHTVSKDTHIAYPAIVKALGIKDWTTVRELVEPKSAIVKYGNGKITIQGNTLLWAGKPFHNALAHRVMEMIKDEVPIDPMVKFMENLMTNPSQRSIDQLYGFLEKNRLPITEDGHFLAFKKVRTDYKDIHSATISNHVGAVVKMDRSKVADDPAAHCSVGLHFCSESYLQSFGSQGDPVMVLKINPADVVSVPNDYDGAKGRCCKYKVVSQVSGDPKATFSTAVETKIGKEVPVTKVTKRKATPKAVPRVTARTPITGVVAKSPKLYDVYRVGNGIEVLRGVTLSIALAKIAAHRKGKKAVLEYRKAV